jgi:iron complex outermembrane recepter protein
MKNSNLIKCRFFRHSSLTTAIRKELHAYKIMAILPLCFAMSASMAAETAQTQKIGETTELEEIIVTGKFPNLKVLTTTKMEANIVNSKRAAMSDTAKLIEDVPGVSLYGAGGVSSLPVIHGLNDDRVKIEINGMTLGSVDISPKPNESRNEANKAHEISSQFINA